MHAALTKGERFDAVISDGQMPDVDGFMLARKIKQHRRLANTPIVMLTSIGSAGDTAMCRKIGVDAYLTKPVKHSDLLDTLSGLFGVSTRQPVSSTDKPAAGARPKRRLRVLVAEDNPVNRKLVAKLLQKRGHQVSAVENGQLAVSALTSSKNSTYDAVLMDLQMPVMSGLEATESIRAYERAHGGRVPIIALTAHAMQGDRERCLAT